MGYIKFSKWISLLKPNEIKQIFEDRLVIIDEAHNIRSIEKDSKKKTTGSQGIDKLVSHNYNTRLLLLSATPMFNSYKEIISKIFSNFSSRKTTPLIEYANENK